MHVVGQGRASARERRAATLAALQQTRAALADPAAPAAAKVAALQRLLDARAPDLALRLRLLLPAEHARGYALSDAALLATVGAAMGADIDEVVAAFESGPHAGDAGRVLADAYAAKRGARTPAHSTLLLREVDALLDELAAASSEAARRAVVSRLLARATAADVALLVALVRREPPRGLDAELVLDSLGPAARRLWAAAPGDWSALARALAAAELAAAAAGVLLELAALGAYKEGDELSALLLGVWDAAARRWKTVCRCGDGLDAAVRAALRLQPVGADLSALPAWLDVSAALAPDLVVTDPALAPVCLVAAEALVAAPAHTAGGLGLRAPRIVSLGVGRRAQEAATLASLRALAPPAAAAAPSPASASASASSSAADAPPICKYGTACYRTRNPAHLAEFRHPHLDAAPAAPAEEGEDGEEEGEEESADARPLCEYGDACYRKNPTHFAEFRHPSGHPKRTRR